MIREYLHTVIGEECYQNGNRNATSGKSCLSEKKDRNVSKKRIFS